MAGLQLKHIDKIYPNLEKKKKKGFMEKMKEMKEALED